MYALVEIQGKQYKAEPETKIQVDRMALEVGSAVEFDSVLLLSADQVKIGAPYVAGAKVKAVVEEHPAGKKVRVHKYKRRKNYARTYGHRSAYTRLLVKEIIAE